MTFQGAIQLKITDIIKNKIVKPAVIMKLIIDHQYNLYDSIISNT